MRTLTLAMLCLLGCSKQGAAPEAKPPSPPPVANPAPLQRPTVPAELAVPDDHKLVLIASARGSQIYECATDGAAPAWKLHAPSAELLDEAGAQIGVHFGGVDKNLPPGPYWESTRDGSRVHGGSPASVPNQGSIPLLRLTAADTSGNGVFAKVSFIHRLATTGGMAPIESCTAGKRADVPYTAQYYFYSAP